MMKSKKNYRLITLALSMFLAISAFAQPKIKVTEEMVPMTRGEQPAFVLLAENGDMKDVEKEMRKAFKEYKGKVEGNSKDEIVFVDVTIKSISDNALDIYVKMYEVGEDVKVNAFFDMGGEFLTREAQPEQADIVVDIMENLGLRYQKTLVEAELKDEEKTLKDLEKDLSGLIKDNEKMFSGITAAERDIEKLERDIVDNKVDQENQRAMITQQKEVVNSLENALGDEKKVSEKTLKDLEKELEKLEKDNEKMHKKIESNESDIAQAERDIEKNQDEQVDKRKEISDQEDVVKEVEKRLKAFPKFK